MPQQLNFELFNPFRRPEWRFERVLQMVDRMPNPLRASRRDDEFVRGLRNFVLRYRAYDEEQRNALGYENPGLYWAYQVFDRRHEDAGRKATLIEARLLAGQSDEDIAKELCTIPETVYWYESLFFNVRDRLQAYDWIIDHILMPAYFGDDTGSEDEDEEANGPAAAAAVAGGGGQQPQAPMVAHNPFRPVSEPFFDCTTKFFAYFGGPYVLDYVLTGFRRGAKANGHEEVGAWLDNHHMNRIRHRSAMAAQTFEVNRYNVMHLFEVHNQIIAIERSAENQEKAKDSMHKAVEAMLGGMRWAAGTDGADLVDGTPLKSFDGGAAELRDDELLLMAAGQKSNTIESVRLMTLPPPRRRAGQEDQPNANAQQGS